MWKSDPSAIGFGRTTTEKRFVAAFGAVVLVVAGAAYMTLTGLEELHSMMHRSVASATSVIQAHRLESALHTRLALQAETTILGTTDDLERYDAAQQDLEQRIADARASGAEPPVLLDRIERQQTASARAFRERVVPAVMADDRATVRAEHQALRAGIGDLAQELDDESARVERQLAGFDDHASSIAHAGFRNALLMLMGVALFTAVVGIVLGRSVAKPIALLHAGARRIADGDPDARLPIAGPHEFRALAVQFNEMVVATRDNQARLAESERLAGIGRLAAGVAHEINNPLGVILGFTKLVKQHVDDPAVHADLQVIEDECKRCHEIVRGLLDLARPPVDQATQTSVRDMLDELVERMEQTDPERSRRIAIHGQGEVWANARTVRQVLVNLIDNALQADPTGAVEVCIRPDDPLVSIDVIDHGQGLPDGDREQLFEPFFTTKDTGTGLGLAVSRAIARAHGGDLIAEDGTDGGARFTLTLPAREPEAAS